MTTSYRWWPYRHRYWSSLFTSKIGCRFEFDQCKKTFDDINWMIQRGINFLLVNYNETISYRQQSEILPVIFMTIQHSYKCWPWWIDINVRTHDMHDVSTTTLVDMYWLLRIDIDTILTIATPKKDIINVKCRLGNSNSIFM